MITDKIIPVEFENVVERLKVKFGVNSNTALSEALGMSAAGIAVARKSNSLPIIPIVNTCLKKGISIDEIFTGKGSDSTNSQSPAQASDSFTKDDMVRASEVVDRVLDKVLIEKSVPDDRQFAVFKTLRPVLIDAVFEHDFNERYVYIIAKSALTLA